MQGPNYNDVFTLVPFSIEELWSHKMPQSVWRTTLENILLLTLESAFSSWMEKDAKNTLTQTTNSETNLLLVTLSKH